MAIYTAAALRNLSDGTAKADEVMETIMETIHPQAVAGATEHDFVTSPAPNDTVKAIVKTRLEALGYTVNEGVTVVGWALVP